MATQLWEQEIDKTVDWGGDSSTGGAAVSGQYVQKFIKDTLAKKFGYLHYDRTALKYLVFADEDDANKYINDNNGEFANLLLTTFDAPPPATIKVIENSNQVITILSSEKNQKISLKYIVTDSGDNPITETVQARIQFNNAGTVQTLTRNFAVDFDNYKEGTTQTIDIDNYLTVGTNNITVTLTGLSTQASTTLTFQYTVVELVLISDFNNKQAIVVDESKGTKDNYFRVPFAIQGQGQKYMRWYINGQLLKQGWAAALEPDLGIVQTGDLMVTSQAEYSSNFDIYLSDNLGQLGEQFHYGKNTIQFYMYIKDGDKEIKSQTKYFDFIITSKQDVKEETYILYSQDLDAGAVFTSEDTIQFSTVQYSSTSFKYGLYSSSGMAVNLNFELSKTDEYGNKTIIANLVRSISSGEEQIFEYSFLTYGKIDIIITTSSTYADGTPHDKLHLIVDVAMSSVQIAVNTDGLVLNLEALNRSNTEPNPAIWSYRGYETKFNNVLWNSVCGWDGKALMLNNGATIEIPINVFDQYTAAGLTFELDFETVNVQDEDTVLLTVQDPNNKSMIRFTGCEGYMNDGNLPLNTNFVDNRRMKIAMIFNQDGTPDPENARYNSSMFIMVDGILDRALNFNASSLKWVSPTDPKIVIGDTTGKAGIKVYSIRIYSKALTLDEELTNWIAESDDMLAKYEDNNIYAEGTNEISLDIVKNITPTMVLYGDTNLLNSATDKGENIECDVEFYNPDDPDLDFYARGAWVSCQGTSSMMYPKKNFRLYFGKTSDKKTKDKSKITEDLYWTEFYRAGEFTHGELTEDKLGVFQCNKKTCADKYHKLYNKQQAEAIEKRGEQLFVNISGEFYPCSFGDDSALEAGEKYYVSMYQPLRDWLTVKQFRYSGATLYAASEVEVENPITGAKYMVKEFSKQKKALKEGTTYYVDQACWKQSAVSGWTNRWTLKTDYAESSMCHNGGIARVWGNAMKNVMTDKGYECRTGAQAAMAQLPDGIDIRTSCDGVPIFMFGCDVKRDDKGNPVIENGLRQYEPARFIGQFNIMTDKGSTPLFGFENIYDEKGNLIFDAAKVECWEASNNDGAVLKWKTLATDTDKSNIDMGRREVFANNFEPRWPDVEIEASDGEEYLVAHTMGIERLLRFINFCKPAVNYLVDGMDGYEVSEYREIPEERYQEIIDKSLQIYYPDPQSIETGNIKYVELDYKGDINNIYANASNGIFEHVSIDIYNISKELSDVKIEGNIYKGKIASFDAKHGVYVEDIQFDDERVDEVNTNYGDAIKGSEHEEDYYVEVYLIQEGGNKFKYINEYGEKVDFTGIRYDDYEKDKNGKSFAGKTYMDYFSEKKYEYFDVPKLAAYYIYLMRFAGVDQSVKNSMLTTEDGLHYYYINYDNDTALGVRNDGQIIYHWSIDRNTIDITKRQTAYAGQDSVLWNLLEADEDFMRVVKDMDNAMYNSNVLSTKIVLDFLNTKQQDEWCERSYNKQEEIKYLSQWLGTSATYLKFIHGARSAHRTWFVTNRFNLFDAKWFSGEFYSHRIKLYIGIVNASQTNPVHFLNLSAARQSVFGITTSDLNGTVPDEWNIDLAMNETKPIYSKITTNIISGPMVIMGVDKIKVLDFRPSVEAQFGFAELQFDEQNSNWFEVKGTMMTKVLFGISDEFRTGLAHRYTNNTDSDITFTINGQTITVKPGEHYDSDVSTNQYGNLKYDTVGATRCTVYGLGGLNKIKTLEEVDIRNCFNDEPKYHFNDLAIDNLSNLHIYRAIGSSITTFKPAQGVILNEVSLPVNRITNIDLNAVSFVPLTDEYRYTNTTNKDIELVVNEEETVTVKAFDVYSSQVDIEKVPEGISKEFFTAPEVFKYTPDAILTTFKIKNVTGLDVKDFIDKWVKAIHDSGEQKNENGQYGKYTLSLENVNMTEVPVDWVLNTITQFKWSAFTGKVTLIGSGEGGTLTEDEYNAIVEQYGINVFNPSSNLVFDAPEGIFWTITGAEKVLLGDEDERLPGMTQRDKEYYIGTHGVEYTIKATVFPISAENTIHYVQAYPDASDKYTKENTAEYDKETGISKFIGSTVASSTIENSSNGIGKFKSTARTANYNRDILYRITGYSTEPGKQAKSVGNVYLKLNKIQLPTVIETTATIGEEVFDTSAGLTVEKTQNYKVTLKLKDGESVSLPVDQFTVKMDNNTNGNTAMQIVNVTKGETFEECYFEIQPTIQDVDVTGNIVISINFKSEFADAQKGLTATLPVTIKSIPATGFELYAITGYDEEGKEILSETPVIPGSFAEKTDGIILNAVDRYEFRLVQLPLNCNVGIGSINVENVNAEGFSDFDYTNLEFDENDQTKLIIEIEDNKEYSFDDEFASTITVNPIYDTLQSITKVYRVDASIIYPEAFELRLDVNNPNTSIEKNISMLNDSSKYNKLFNLHVYAKDVIDTVTYPYIVKVADEANPVKVEISDTYADKAPKFTLVKENDSIVGLQVEIPANPGKADEIKCSIDLIIEYNIGPKLKQVTRTISFNIYRTLAFANSKIGITSASFEDGETPCLLIDNNGNYYKLDSTPTLYSTNQLNNIIGIATFIDSTNDPEKLIGIPLYSISEIINDNNLSMFWPNSWETTSNAPAAISKWNNVYSNRTKLFNYGIHPSVSNSMSVVASLYLSHVGNSLIDYATNSKHSLVNPSAAGKWVPGYILTEALCADNWIIGKNSNQNHLSLTPNGVSTSDPRQKFNFVDINLAAEPINTINATYKLIMPRIYNFFELYTKESFWGYDDKPDTSNVKCYIGSWEEYSMLALSFNNICEALDKVLEYYKGFVGDLADEIYSKSIVSDLKDIIINYNQRNNAVATPLRFITSSLNYRIGATSPGGNIAFSLIKLNADNAIKASTEGIYELDFDSNSNLAWNTANQGNSVTAIPFIQLK